MNQPSTADVLGKWGCTPELLDFAWDKPSSFAPEDEERLRIAMESCAGPSEPARPAGHPAGEKVRQGSPKGFQ